MRAVAITLTLLAVAAIPAAGPETGQWQQTVDKAVAYLRTHQDASGSWSSDRSPGVTGIALTGLLHTGRVTPDDEVAAKALKYIESLINEKAGHIAGADPKPQLLNYVTSINVMALQAANRPDKYRKVVGDAAAFLKNLQFDEGEGKDPKDPFYAGRPGIRHTATGPADPP